MMSCHTIARSSAMWSMVSVGALVTLARLGDLLVFVAHGRVLSAYRRRLTTTITMARK